MRGIDPVDAVDARIIAMISTIPIESTVVPDREPYKGEGALNRPLKAVDRCRSMGVSDEEESSRSNTSVRRETLHIVRIGGATCRVVVEAGVLPNGVSQ